MESEESLQNQQQPGLVLNERESSIPTDQLTLGKSFHAPHSSISTFN